MKKMMLAAVIVVITIVNVSAQTSFGAKAGVNFANLTGDVEDVGSRTGILIGGVAEISISDKFSFQPELLYSQQGAKESGDGYSYTMKLDYLNIPLIAKYYVTDGLSLEAGPQIGFLMAAKEDWEEDGESGSEDLKDYLKSTDFGLNFGLGYKLESGLNFGARYNLGLSNILDIDVDIDEDDGSVKNGVFQLSVGYFF